MGRTQDFNTGASAACLVVAVIVGVGTQSFWGGAIAFVIVVGTLAAMRIIRLSHTGEQPRLIHTPLRIKKSV